MNALRPLLIVALLVPLGGLRPSIADDLARAWLSIEANSGRVLAAHSSTKPSRPASLVKLMTVYMTLAAVDSGAIELTSELIASHRAASQPPTRLGIRPGERLSVEHAIKALLVRSANDVAVMVAENVGGTQPRFVRRMNRAARALGMTRTVFQNPSGLPDEGQMTTALDSALLVDALLRRFPHHGELLAVTQLGYRGRTLRRSHGLFGSAHGIRALKTGFTCRSGYNVAVAAVQANQWVIAVVLGAGSARARDELALTLVSDSFSKSGRRAASLQRLERRPSPGVDVNTLALAERCQ